MLSRFTGNVEQDQKLTMSAELKDALEILIVDDCLDTTASWGLLLRAWGHEVTIAHTGPEALQLAEQRPPDVILLDIGLPGMNGWEVAQRLRRIPGLEHAVLIAVSGYGREEDQLRSREAGCDLHLCKPVDLNLLEQLLTRHHQRKASQNVTRGTERLAH